MIMDMMTGRRHTPPVTIMSPARWKLYEELIAVCMLAGEPKPIICSGCLAEGKTRGAFGSRRCRQCGGYGYDWMGPVAKKWLVGEFGER